MVDPKKPVERDALSGVETTGHEWDGIKELNLPAPRWWLFVFLITCVWALWYSIIYPSWPTANGGTKGTAGWTQYKKLADEQAEINSVRGAYVEKINQKTPAEIQADPELYNFAIAGGKTIFKENCAACHGTGAQGGKGYPNLNDDDWIWGGTVDDIYTTLKYGIRSPHESTRTSMMPAFGKDGLLNAQQIASVADYVLSLSSGKGGNAGGEEIYKQNCSACHGDDGRGKREFGAPSLADAIWLYGGDKASIIQQLNAPRHGIMPAWETRLPDATIKQLSIYVHSLGGGEKAAPVSAAPAQ